MSESQNYSAHTDFLHVTVPYEQAGQLRFDLYEACGDGSASERADGSGIFDMYGGQGTMLLARRGGVLIVGFSGGTIAGMRASGTWAGVLRVLVDLPHRVTLLDAAYDVAEEAAPTLESLYEKYKRSGVRFGQRAVGVSKTGWKVGVTGNESGTVYFGTRKSEVRARVYDKRQERIDRKHEDPGPLIRYEVTVTGKAAAISLRDAWDPTALFWHYAGGRLLDRPSGIPAWVAGGIGFDIKRSEPRSAYERLQRFLSDNPNWFRLLELADACGPGGRRLVINKLTSKARNAAQLAGEGGAS